MTQQLYPIAFTISPGNVNILPWERELRSAFNSSPSLTGAISAALPLDEARAVCRSHDLTPYLGIIAPHQDGDGLISSQQAQELLPQLAQAYTRYSGRQYKPPSGSLTEDRQANLLLVVADLVDCQWNIPLDSITDEIDQRHSIASLLDDASDQSSTR